MKKSFLLLSICMSCFQMAIAQQSGTVTSLLPQFFAQNEARELAILPSTKAKLIDTLATTIGGWENIDKQTSAEEKKRIATFLFNMYNVENYSVIGISTCLSDAIAGEIGVDELQELYTEQGRKQMHEASVILAEHPDADEELMRNALAGTDNTSIIHLSKVIQKAVLRDTIYEKSLTEHFLRYAYYRRNIDLSHDADYYKKQLYVLNNLKGFRDVVKTDFQTTVHGSYKSYLSSYFERDMMLLKFSKDFSVDNEILNDIYNIVSDTLFTSTRLIFEDIVGSSYAPVTIQTHARPELLKRSHNVRFQNIDNDFYLAYLKLLKMYYGGTYEQFDENMRDYIHYVQCRELLNQGLTVAGLNSLLQIQGQQIQDYISTINTAVAKANNTDKNELSSFASGCAYEWIECLMTPKTLQAYRESHKNSPNTNLADNKLPTESKNVNVPDVLAKFCSDGNEMNALNDWINANMNISANILQSDTTEIVDTRFTVGADGSISDIRVLHSRLELDDCFKKEIIRVLSEMPKWIPAQKDSTAIASTYYLPIEFKIDSGKVVASYCHAEYNAQFSGGETGLYSFISQHMKYPALCQEKGIQGSVLLKFVVEKDGSLSDITILHSPNKELSKEAIRVISLTSGSWIPAHQGNRTVRAEFTLPVMFRLN